MATLQEIRQQYPQYKDMPDNVLADKLYQKFYSDVPREQFDAQLGLSAKPPSDKWYGEEPGIAAKLLQGAGSIATGVSDVMTGRVDPKSDQGIANITDAALLGTPVSAASRSSIGWAGVPLKAKTTAVAPAGVELKSIGGAGFDMARGMDVRYKPSRIKNGAFKLQSQLIEDGYVGRKESAGETFAVLRDILKSGDESGAFVTIDNLHTLRKRLGDIAQNFNRPTDQKAAVRVIKFIDEFITNPDPAAVVAGDAAEAGRIWKNAMGDYAAGSKSGELKGLESNAEIDAAVANSGANLENRIRARVGAVLKSKKELSGYTPQEVKLMDELAKGTTFRNWVRKVGNLGGGGGALAALMGALGLHFGGPLGVGAAIAVPAAAKLAGNRMAKSALRNIDETVRERSPFHQAQIATSPVIQPLSSTLRSAPLRGGAAVPLVRDGRSYGPAPDQPPMTKEQFEEYLRQKYARDQGA